MSRIVVVGVTVPHDHYDHCFDGSGKLNYSEGTRLPGVCGGETYCKCTKPYDPHSGSCPNLSMSCCMLSRVDELEVIAKTPVDDLLLLVGRILTRAGTRALAKRFEEDF